MAKYSEKAKRLTNEELADELIRKVWAHSTLGTYREALIDECIARLKGIGRK